MKQFESGFSLRTDRRTWLREVLAPLGGVLGITVGLVAIFYGFLFFGKYMSPVIPPHMDDGEAVDPSPTRFIFMLIAFVVSLVLARVSIRKGDEGKTWPAFWVGYTGGTLLWQSIGESSWHFSIVCEDYLMCFPHLEGASSLFLVILSSLLIIYAYRHHSFGWGFWTFLLSFIGNWFGHFVQIGSYPFVAELMEEGQWFVITGFGFGLPTIAAAVLLSLFSANTAKARLCCSLLLYFGIGIVVTGVGGL